MYRYFIKRMIDIAIGIVGIIVLIPFLIILSPIIFITDRGPILYRGERLGYKCKIFKMLKFRSMKINAPDLRNADGSTFNSEDDPRVTRIGRFMRKTSIARVIIGTTQETQYLQGFLRTAI